MKIELKDEKPTEIEAGDVIITKEGNYALLIVKDFERSNKLGIILINHSGTPRRINNKSWRQIFEGVNIKTHYKNVILRCE